jgi:hypothetical protein
VSLVPTPTGLCLFFPFDRVPAGILYARYIPLAPQQISAGAQPFSLSPFSKTKSKKKGLFKKILIEKKRYRKNPQNYVLPFHIWG